MLQNKYLTKKQSEPVDLRQGHVVRQVAAPYSVWHRFPLCPSESNGNENFKVIQNPGFLPDHPQNWITSSLCHFRHTLKISERSVHNFLSYLANTHTNRQTNKVRQKHYLLGGGKYTFSAYMSMWNMQSESAAILCHSLNLSSSHVTPIDSDGLSLQCSPTIFLLGRFLY